MQILIDKEYTKNVLIITPKKEEGQILYFTFNIEDDFKPMINSNTIPDETVIEDGSWYKYTSIYGKRIAHLLCKDDCLVVLYNYTENKEGIDRNSISVYYSVYDLPDRKQERMADYTFWNDKDCVYNIEFIEFLKYYMQKRQYDEYNFNKEYLKEKCIDIIHHPFFELSRKYYEERNKTEQTSKYGYGFYELSGLFIEYFEEIMPEESYNVYTDLQVYNKTYVPKEYYDLDDNKKKGDIQ